MVCRLPTSCGICFVASNIRVTGGGKINAFGQGRLGDNTNGGLGRFRVNKIFDFLDPS